MLFHDARVEVVRGRPLPMEEGPIPGTMWRLYSCVRGGRAHFLLLIGDVGEDTGQSIDHVRLAGRFGAFHVVTGSYSTDFFDHVEVFDLATGHRVARSVEDDTYFRVLTTLALDDAGTAAWAYSSTIDRMTGAYQPPGPPVELYGASTARAVALLDTGTVDPASVTLIATTVSWTNAGSPRHADLGGQ